MIAKNPDVRDAGCPSCDYGLPQACTCEESLGSEGKALRGEAGSSDQQPTSDPKESTAASIRVTIKADTRSLRRGLIEAGLAMRPRLLRRLRLRWQLWKVNREPAP